MQILEISVNKRKKSELLSQILFKPKAFMGGGGSKGKKIVNKFGLFSAVPGKSGPNWAKYLLGRSCTFTRPLLSYAAEYSASWQHCEKWDVLIRPVLFISSRKETVPPDFVICISVLVRVVSNNEIQFT